MSRRSSTILRIMGIEQKKRELLHDKHFIRLQENNTSFSNLTYGRLMKIHDPFNLNNTIDIRLNPETVQKYKQKNDELLQDYQKRINALMNEKARLQKKIF